MWIFPKNIYDENNTVFNNDLDINLFYIGKPSNMKSWKLKYNKHLYIKKLLDRIIQKDVEIVEQMISESINKYQTISIIDVDTFINTNELDFIKILDVKKNEYKKRNSE